ncbi:TAXI family TRAP transporter solute-binding subunit [Candidatus Venteria ishoeyi]|uniref:NMT1/THI5 like protein n=1 Tax=Candidatus Venteria ishoeyi TaxID=1899563 RepID=A0A1H6FEE0_9GAMM|nr:TAXI family TRAP transporter solute-binding subunit [Candidatus Venteria ishoeyi]MDM8546817.1 TAXI family TRAP transporter solute-binding subunit [Candidatus Venteria ishoeyi]SEH08407.1 NMT1/THI5 like protein [Candidatus Venteria ishoeyi]
MKTWLYALLLSLSVNVLAQSQNELTIVTGRESGSYYKIAKDLQKLLAPHHIDLNVVPSIGSVENIVKVYEFPSIQLGIAQLDSMSFQSLQALVRRMGVSGELQHILKNMQVVLPLYQEEVHVLAQKNIKSLQDLAGKTIAIGSRASGTHGTALNILHMFGVQPKKMIPLDAHRAIQAMSQGKLDALFYVSAAPAQLLQKNVNTDSGLHLLAIDLTKVSDSALKSVYKTKQLPANTYAWQKQAVTMLSVGSVLFTADTGECSLVGQFAGLLYNNLKILQEKGHPKWKEVTFERDKLITSEGLSPCVLNQLKAEQ